MLAPRLAWLPEAGEIPNFLRRSVDASTGILATGSSSPSTKRVASEPSRRTIWPAASAASTVISHRGRSLANELIAEWREEAQRENAS